MTIDPTKPVNLRKGVVDPKTGNTYIPLKSGYAPGTLPKNLINDANCIQIEQPDTELNSELTATTVTTAATVNEYERKIHPSAEYLDTTIPTQTLNAEKAPKKPSNKSADENKE